MFYGKHRGFWEHLEAYNPALRDYGSLFLKGEHDNTYLKGVMWGLNNLMHKNAWNRTPHTECQLRLLLSQHWELWSHVKNWGVDL